MALNSPMTHQFSIAPTVGISRSKFSRPCTRKFTFDSGYLIPFYCDEVLPGDTFDVDATILIRETTPIVPIMDNLKLSTFFFFVPNRLVWEHWQNFCGERKDPDDSIDYLVPQIEAPAETGFGIGSVFDYLGLPVQVPGISVNALPFRALNLIYNEWFRDENLIDSLPVNVSDLDDNATDFALQRRGKRYDYFTSALPFPQKGPGVELPLGTSAPVFAPSSTNEVILPAVYYGSDSSLNGVRHKVQFHITNSNPYTPSGAGEFGTYAFSEGDHVTSAFNTNLYADLSLASAATINSLRQAFALQAFYEQFARGGTRYTEILRSFFHVISPDGRLQRPEYLGGNTTMIDSTAVPQTSATSQVTPQGNLSAYVKSVSGNHGFVKSFVEHGYVIGLLQVDADITYQQGIDRMYSRRTMFDFYWPTFAHLGEQAILNKEIYAQGTSDDEGVFGYIPRYDEYRFSKSYVAGKLRSGISGSLDIWHLAEYYTELPTLSKDFIESNPPVKRTLAVQTEPEFLADIFMTNVCIRPIPVYGTPSTIGNHF